ncbi:MAG: hypothetical protein HQ582_06120 [Planctomycetes bacterium]|nr:hypothetical protein [Planctomycetota bacterium]
MSDQDIVRELIEPDDAPELAGDSNQREETMEFLVKLIRVPPLAELSGVDVLELMVNARHIGGDFWAFEGDLEALLVPGVDYVGEAATSAFGGMSDDKFAAHCEGLFGSVVRGAPPAWKMLAEQGR